MAQSNNSPTTKGRGNENGVVTVERPSRNPFKRLFKKKKAEEAKTDEEIKDEREPVIRAIDHLIIFKIFGWNWLLILIGSIGSLGIGVVPLSFQYVVGDLVDVFQMKNGAYTTVATMKSNVSTISINLTIIAICCATTHLLSSFFLSLAGDRISVALRKAYFNALTRQEMGFFDIKKTGALTIALSEDVAKIQDAFSNKLALVLQYTSQCIVGIILAFLSSWSMALVMISTSPLMVIGYSLLTKATMALVLKTNGATANSASIANEVVSSFRTVKSMGCEEKEQERYGKDLKKTHNYGLAKACMQGFTVFVMTIILWGTFALAFWFGGGLVAEGTITVGSMMKCFSLMLYGVTGMSLLGNQVSEFVKVHLSQKTLLKVLKRVPAVPFKGGKKLDKLQGSIQVRNVKFTYPSRPNAVVLSDFSIDIKPGTAVALVGPSGSGKSTIVGLVERFYDPQEGEILIDGYDIKGIDPQWLHRNVAIVTQEPVLFANTIRENIAYAVGSANVTQEQIEQAAKSANCHNFIMDLPDQYNTKIGEKGVSLSGGQKQRVAIARAILQNPQILLLDEATSALDTESEALVQSALDNLMKGRTTICIAHRLSTVQNCDAIYVLVNGELKEFGNHQELMGIEDGVYKKLAEKQIMFGKNEEEGDDSAVDK